MKLLEVQGKRLLADAGIPIPSGRVVTTPAEASAAAAEIDGKVVLKSQVHSGKRGKSGGIQFATSADAARTAATQLLGSTIRGNRVSALLLEECVDIDRELYLAVLNDPVGKQPLVLFSATGGMDIEDTGASAPDQIQRLPVDIRLGLHEDAADTLLRAGGLAEPARGKVRAILLAMYRLYRSMDADLVEINPLAITSSGNAIALDSKVSLDPAALSRHAELIAGLDVLDADSGESQDSRTKQAAELGLQYVELGGTVGVLANGAGLTMTTVDAVRHFGGTPANFLEIGGDAYTKAVPALRLVLANPDVRSLLVNFCGAFARTDVMTGGVLDALAELRPTIPVFFSIHGTGEAEAIQLVQDRLGAKPFDQMDDAVRAAVAAAGNGANA